MSTTARPHEDQTAPPRLAVGRGEVVVSARYETLSIGAHTHSEQSVHDY